MSWTEWRGEIAKACDGSHHSIESIEALIDRGVLKPLFADGCCFLVELQDYPGERACQVMWAAGELSAVIAAVPDLHAWARLHGCTEMLVEGRPGWARSLRQLDYRPWSVTLRRRLDGPE
jgi:hypothetical protein